MIAEPSPLSPRSLPQAKAPSRILVIRLDRIGDVVLSTPVLRALRQTYPESFIAMMVRPPCREVVEGHPDLNELVLYDKAEAHRGIRETIRFAWSLRRYRFDTALILHPSNRSHWIPYWAGIPTRIGYNRKSAWLLTHRVPHVKQEGAQHEAVYTLEMLKVFGLTPPWSEPLVPVRRPAVARVEQFLHAESVEDDERLIAIHPSASCISKRWRPERFAAVADRLVSEHQVRVCLIADAPGAVFAQRVAQRMERPVIDFSGRLGLAELAALLHRCQLLISNDSGPVHIAAAVRTPVVDIFGRNQRGLSAQRWGPLGEGHAVLHKEVGCVTCLAHNCDIEFLCLTSLSSDEVYAAAAAILNRVAVS